MLERYFASPKMLGHLETVLRFCVVLYLRGLDDSQGCFIITPTMGGGRFIKPICSDGRGRRCLRAGR
jgi:hypothetical protein